MQSTRDPASRERHFSVPLIHLKEAAPVEGEETRVERERLYAAAHAATEQWREAPPERHHTAFLKRAKETANVLDIALRTGAKTLATADRNWLLENARVLMTALREAQSAAKGLDEQPSVTRENWPIVPRSYAVAVFYLEAVERQFTEQSWVTYVTALQERQQLQMNELWALKPMMQFVLLEHAAAVAKGEAAGHLPAVITSLRAIGETDWKELFRATNVVDPVLLQDPAGAYARMEEDSREMYRQVITDLATRSQRSEREVAAVAVAMAQEVANRPARDAEWHARRQHVGYYLIDLGLPRLRARLGYRPSWRGRVEEFVVRQGEGFYLVGIESITMLVMYLLLNQMHALAPVVWLLVLLPLPVSQAAVELMNTLTTSLLRPRRLAKLDLSEGVPEEFATMVAVPTLLLSEKQVKQLVEDLEIRYLANTGPNLYFALLTDAPDSPQPVDEKDELSALAVKLIEQLNERYGTGGSGPFYLFHRHRVFNPTENTWMGWERKRGKLLDLNKLLRNEFDSFPVKVGDLSVLPKVRFVITLDSDTQLPREAAHRLIGTLAHPLNRPVVDRETNMVVAGYGILQPRVGVSVPSATRSRLASLLSGQTGFDIYTRAVSDVYQDLFGEGIFTGKGIYDVDALRAVLDHRFPCNALLSHDLIEGAYARVALVSEIEVIDDYPSHFSAYSRRKHRWMRGDWQIMRWLQPRVPDFSGNIIANPISMVSRWKILDNLRRSLMEPAVFALLLAGWFFLPGGPLFWTLASLGLMLLSTYANLLFSLLRWRDMRTLGPFLKETGKTFLLNHASVLISIALLAHQAMTSLDAIVRTLVRSTITRRNLLEWETAAQAEAGSRKRTPVDLYLDLTPWVALALTAALTYWRPEAVQIAAPFLVAWASSKTIAHWLDQPPRPERWIFRSSSQRLLRGTALQTWRYFRTYSNAENHWLIPDNVQESPESVAQRISPTNLGFLLNARQAAWELGYLTLLEFVEQTSGTLRTAARMPRRRGHFVNWYDTTTLKPLAPEFVSTVDSGNLAACLWTLAQGCRAMITEPLIRPALWQGIRDHICRLAEIAPEALREVQRQIAALGDDAAKWLQHLEQLEQELRRLSPPENGSEEFAWWLTETLQRIRQTRGFAETFAPWHLPEHRALSDALGEMKQRLATATLESLPAAISELETVLARLEWNQRAGDEAKQSLLAMETILLPTKLAAVHLQRELREIAEAADQFVAEMDFSFLYVPRRKLLAIGYDAAAEKLERSSYDLLASEARTASFIAIAKGDIPQEHWFHLGRTLTASFGQRVLLSWTGTMFEYLMPSLWMRTYPNTILDESMRAMIVIQQEYARRKRVPWGISEAAHSLQNEQGDYQYQAFGLRDVALHPGATESVVVSPYASLLALPFEPAACMRNMRGLQERGVLGRYGFYESIDFSHDPAGTVVRCWMAHHQGMVLLAAANLLLESPFPRYFHAEPKVLATELLLHEKVPRTVPVEPKVDVEPDQEEEAALASAGA